VISGVARLVQIIGQREPWVAAAAIGKHHMLEAISVASLKKAKIIAREEKRCLG
jgi:hypothetical protein